MKKLRTKLIRLGLGLLAVALTQATPFDHPNYRVALPGLVVGELAQFNADEITRQNPQYDVFVAGGLVGLFSRVPYIPVWTTLDVGWREPEQPNFERWGQLGTGAGDGGNSLPVCGGPRNPCPLAPCGLLSPCNPPEVPLQPPPPSLVPEPPAQVVVPPSEVVVPPSEVPEPSSVWMSLLGGALMGLVFRLP